MKQRNATQPVRKEAQGRYGLALGWLKRGRIKEAILSLWQALEIEPDYLDPYLELGRILLHLHRWNDLIDLCRRGLVYYIEVPELHKMMITALQERGSLDDAYKTYELSRMDERCLDFGPREILCCTVVRNEMVRLPSFFKHYRALGVDRFFFIDNDSSDGTPDWLLRQPDVHLWRSPLSFKRANFGSSWFELLLRRHGIDHWTLTVDADEFLVYEGSPGRSLRSLCDDLEQRGQQAVSGMLLDMYGKGPICDTRLPAGTDPLEACPYFDREYCTVRDERGGHYRNQTIFFGGVRQRVFPAEHDYLLSKIPLLRYRADVVLTSGQHLTNLPYEHIAHEQACLLHFKFTDTFLPYAHQEAAREEHSAGGLQYKAYVGGLQRDPGMSLFDPGQSIRFEGVQQLQELGIMRPEPLPSVPVFPPIAPVIALEPRPFWSVMITLYDRLHNLEQVVGSVLRQLTDDMQVEVVNDGADPALQHELVARLERLAGDRVRAHCLGQRIGHPHIFNLCVSRARGQWVHILHDDDRVEPGFYQALREGIAAAPEAGAAFTQHSIIASGPAEPILWRSWAERETPGLIDDWLQRIAVECRLQFSAMTVKREAYEAVGGFCEQAHSALDWEMWVRLAARYPVWYVPRSLATIGRDGSAESSRLLRNGQQVTDALRAIEVFRWILPPADSERLVDKARERFGLYALDVARRYLEIGDMAAALANLRAAAASSTSARVTGALLHLLREGRDEIRF